MLAASHPLSPVTMSNYRFAFAHAPSGFLQLTLEGDCPVEDGILDGVVAVDEPAYVFYIKPFNGLCYVLISVVAQVQIQIVYFCQKEKFDKAILLLLRSSCHFSILH